MDLLFGTAILLAILFTALVAVPYGLVKTTESENGKGRKGGATTFSIMWDYLYRGPRGRILELGILTLGWVGLHSLPGRFADMDFDERVLAFSLAAGCVGGFFLFYCRFFKCSVDWFDNRWVMFASLITLFAITLLNVISEQVTFHLGVIITLWWSGRLMMYKALDKHASGNEITE